MEKENLEKNSKQVFKVKQQRKGRLLGVERPKMNITFKWKKNIS